MVAFPFEVLPRKGSGAMASYCVENMISGKMYSFKLYREYIIQTQKDFFLSMFADYFSVGVSPTHLTFYETEVASEPTLIYIYIYLAA